MKAQTIKLRNTLESAFIRIVAGEIARFEINGKRGVKVWKCNLCNETFSTKHLHSFANHLQEHHGLRFITFHDYTVTGAAV